jgi:uncharacterized protein YndB with AHSA1/START domain
MTIAGQEGFTELRVQRRLAHAPEAVWKALTDPDEIVQWMQAAAATVDGRAGGQVDIEAVLHVTGTVLRWDPPRLFEHEFRLAPSRHIPGGEDAVLRYELEPDGDGCLLTMTFMRLTPATVRTFSKGIQAGMQRLVAHLAARRRR